MTRKEALQAAKVIVAQSNIEDCYKNEIIAMLELCETELPFAKWSKNAVFDACDQYCKEVGRNYLRLDDFSKAELPSHSTIKNRFGMTAAEFRDKYYPIQIIDSTGKQSSEMRTEEFIKCYNKINPSSAVDYNKRRTKGACVWQTVAKINGVTTWKQLLNKFGLSHKPNKVTYTVNSSSRSGTVEYIKNVLQTK